MFLNLREVDVDRRVTRSCMRSPASARPSCASVLRTHGLAFPLAHSANVPIGGYLLGGGMGWNGRIVGTHGVAFACAPLDVVTAAGERLTINERSHPDLYWAARGAGPAFCAVATRFHLEAFRVSAWHARGRLHVPDREGRERCALAARARFEAHPEPRAHDGARDGVGDQAVRTAAIACFAATEAEASRDVADRGALGSHADLEVSSRPRRSDYIQ